MAKWTPKQQEAIEARNSNLLIAAAAGSGKTAVLVERILRLVIEDQIPIDQMLIVTFSNAAAGEMRERIQRALTQALSDYPERSTFIRKQINRIGKAYIMTLHAFCNDIVKKHFIEIGLDPSFRIGEASTMELMKQEALNLALEQAYAAEDEAFTYLTESYSTNRSDQKLASLIMKIHSFIQAQPEPLKWLREAVDGLLLTEENFNESPASKAMMFYVGIELEGIIHLAQAGLEKCLEAEGPAEYEANFNSDLEGLERVKEAMDMGYSQAVKAIADMSFTRLATIKKDRKMEISEMLLEEAKSARDQVKRKLTELKNRYFAKQVSDIVDELAFLHDKMLRLAELVEDYQNQYQALKLDKNLLDFNDLEHYALAVLDNESICDLYREQFAHIFLDEYQDANIVQETLINRIKRRDNVFLVGDVKQSIYKFRLADPSLFLDKHKRYPTEAGHVNQRIDLSMNFRTRGEILSTVNDFFAKIMSETLGEINYDKDQYLYNGMVFPRAEAPKTAFHLLDLGEQSELDEEIQYMKTAELEAHYVASQIKSALGKTMYNPKTGESSPLCYGDIVVLLRSTKAWANTFSEIFGQWGIPVFVDMGSSFFEALEVTIVLSLLKIIDNRYRDLEWLTVLRSPLVGLSVEELAMIRGDFQELSYFEALSSYAQTQTDSTSEKLRVFMKQVDHWTITATFKRLDDWLWQILDETNFYSYVGAMPEGPSRQANLRMLMERAGALEGQPETGLYHFIRVIERMEKSGSDLEAAKLMPEQEDAVRIMSIHKSKGLEFPLVVVAGMGKRFNMMDTYEDVMLHKTLGIGPKLVEWEERHFRYTFPQLAMRKQMTNEMLSEEMRILYVALTRPVDELWLVGSVTNWESTFKRWKIGTRPFNLAQAKSYLDWLGMYVFDEMEDEHAPDEVAFDLSRKVKGLDPKTTLPSELSFKKVGVAQIAMERGEKALSDEVLLNRLESAFETPVPLADEGALQWFDDLGQKLNRRYEPKGGQLPSKMTVTALKKLGKLAEEEEQLLLLDTSLSVPSWLVGEVAIGPAERGSAFHKCLEHMSYDDQNSWNEAVADQYKADLARRGVLTKTLAEAVPSEWIVSYTESDLYKRIVRAKRREQEYPFIMKKLIEEDWTLVQGIIDLYFEEENQVGGVLVDFKTDTITSDFALERAIKTHAEQLKLYADAIEMVEGTRPREVWLYFSSIQKWVNCMDTV